MLKSNPSLTGRECLLTYRSNATKWAGRVAARGSVTDQAGAKTMHSFIEFVATYRKRASDATGRSGPQKDKAALW